MESKVLKEISEKGQASFWVVLKDQADLKPAHAMKDWNERGIFVFASLVSEANRTQPRLHQLIQKHNVSFRPFWIVNTIQVTAGAAALDELAAQPEVQEIRADEVFSVPDPLPGAQEATVNGIEWNIDRIGAPLVWQTTKGEGIVVCNIDTGVQYDHPALMGQYRGYLGPGSFEHNYNWYDPAGICGSPSTVPCDNNNHGTHTMGTMVGDDKQGNRIGVAPGAKWIAAKGCEYSSCTFASLLACAQWVLAPTDLSGNNPRPDLRPHVVNNSWGSSPNQPWYQASVRAWVAAGIFPAFSIGNSGSSCWTASSPGDYPESYASGAFDYNNHIASFSSRGPSYFTDSSGANIIKPNIASPGVNVRSSVRNSGYAVYQGTSMASPHTAAAVALIWSMSPALIGDVENTRALLDQTAIDVNATGCGGTAQNNNVWGQGRLDAFSASKGAPVGDLGALQGIVGDAAGSPLAGATVQVTGPMSRTKTTDATGAYQFPHLLTGNYTMQVSLFAYVPQTISVTIVKDQITVQDVALARARTRIVSGTVYDGATKQPVANATVRILNTPIPSTTTDANGAYRFAAVPEATYDMSAEAGCCNLPVTQPVTVAGDITADFALPRKSDEFGYYCQVVPSAYLEAETVLPLSGSWNTYSVPLPFPFTFYGKTYNSAWVSTSGLLAFQGDYAYSYSNTQIPNPSTPNAAIYAFWQYLYVNSSAASIRTSCIGTAPDRKFIVEWRNVLSPMDFEIVLHEKNGQILTQYRNIQADSKYLGGLATIGLENEAGTVGFQYSYKQPVLGLGDSSVLYRVPPSAFLEGKVTDYNDGTGIPGSVVRVYQGGTLHREVRCDPATGYYRTQVLLGNDYTVQPAAKNYTCSAATVSLSLEDATYVQDFIINTPHAEVSPGSVSFVALPGEKRRTTITLSNTGNMPLIWNMAEIGGTPVPWVSAEGLVPSPSYNVNALTTEGQYANLVPDNSPAAVGQVLKSWAPAGMQLAWGVGNDAHVWLSDVYGLFNKEFDLDGLATGSQWDTPWAGAWPGDMAYDAGRGLMFQVNVGGDNGIYSWKPGTGELGDAITGAFPWTRISQRGLAYRPDDDTFYIGGWNEGIIYHIKGLSWNVPGEVIDKMSAPSYNISGLAWDAKARILWEACNSYSDTMYALDPDTGQVLGTLAHPKPYYNGAGLECDENGNLWLIAQSPNTVYLIDSGANVPWLDESPASGTLAPGASATIEFSIDATGLTPGTYKATAFVVNDSGRHPKIKIPVTLIVTDYMVGVNSGGSAYTDTSFAPWFTDKLYSAGGWGYMNKRSTALVAKKNVDGTAEQVLYRNARQDPTEYRFDGVPPGTYQVELKFAELANRQPLTRIFDVIIENQMVLPAHDIAYDAGLFKVDDHTVTVQVTDGQMNVRLVGRRGYAPPIISAIRVAHLPAK